MSSPILFLSAHLPVEKSRQAGHKTAWRNLCWLLDIAPVHLLTFRSEGDRDESVAGLAQICERLEIIDVSRWRRIIGLVSSPQTPLIVAARSNARFARTLETWISATSYDRVHIEWSQLGQYLNQVSSVPNRTLYIHDVLSQWAERRKKGRYSGFWSWEARRTRRWESWAYSRCSKLYVPSRKDEELVVRNTPELRQRTSVLPLHFDVYRSKNPKRYDGPLRILFWGALGRQENAEAARWLCRELVPRLRAQGRKFRLVLAGSNPPPDLLSLQSAEVEVTGFMVDPTQQFYEAHLAVAPLFQGAGVKVKVLECLAAGLPVLTTAIGSEGIEAGSEDGLFTLPSDPDAFGRAVSDLDDQRIRLEQLGAAAVRWGERYNQDHRSVLLG